MSEEKTVLGYDVEALKKDIERHKANIDIFQKAIEDAKQKMEELEGTLK